MTIHVHEPAAGDYDDKYILVDPDHSAALFVHNKEFDRYAKILMTGTGWPTDCKVGEYICTYDEFKDKHPEYFI